MSETNGVFRLKSRGRGKIKFSFGEEGGGKPVFELDPIAVRDEWQQADWTMREPDGTLTKNADGTLPIVAWNQMRHTFVVGIVKLACPEAEPDARAMSQVEVAEFFRMIENEVDKLRPFFEKKSPAPQSSPESTELRFAQ